MASLLEINNVSRHFGGLVALEDISWGVDTGEVVGLIGPNGAGKSTMFNVITGFFAPTKGQILYKGKKISGLKPHVIAGRGVVRTFQLTVLFSEFSVLDNILIGSHLKSSVGKALFSRSRVPKSELVRAQEILEFTGLTHLKDYMAGDLPHGNQRVLGVAIALGADPELLLLDEPVTGMNLDEIKMMVDLVRALQSERGITCVVVEHNVKTVMDLCQRVVVISFGRKIAEGTPDEVRRNEDVIEAYLGREAT
ncbi:ABC transporter ATP-binding protein [Chloroflexota bacterium]